MWSMVTRPGSYLSVRVLLLPWTKNGNQKSKKYCRCDFGLLAPPLGRELVEQHAIAWFVLYDRPLGRPTCGKK